MGETIFGAVSAAGIAEGGPGRALPPGTVAELGCGVPRPHRFGVDGQSGD